MSEGYLQLPKDLSAVPLPTQLLSNEQTTQIKVAKLNAGTFYAFQLSARNACGETVSSVQWFQTQASTPAAPQRQCGGQLRAAGVGERRVARGAQ